MLVSAHSQSQAHKPAASVWANCREVDAEKRVDAPLSGEDKNILENYA